MSKGWNYRSSDWWIICDVCGKKIKASNSRHRWDGLVVCDEDFEHRHPQDFIKVRQDKITVPFLRPRPTDTFVSVSYQGNTLTCTPMSKFAISGTATSGCTVVGTRLPGDL
jgi:hypothetical protein